MKFTVSKFNLFQLVFINSVAEKEMKMHALPCIQ